MKKIFEIKGFIPYLIVVFLNATIKFGYIAIIQNIILKNSYNSFLTFDPATIVLHILILLPCILFFIPIGNLTDKCPKRTIIIACAIINIFVTILAFIAYSYNFFYFALFLTFFMSIQSSIYYPSKLGIIKEFTNNDTLVPVNALVQIATICAICVGIFGFSAIFNHLIPTNHHSLKIILHDLIPCVYILAFLTIIESFFAWYIQIKTAYFSIQKLKTNSKKIFFRGFKLLCSNDIIWLSVIELTIFIAITQIFLLTFGIIYFVYIAIGTIIGAFLAGYSSRNFVEISFIPIGTFGLTFSLALLPFAYHHVYLRSIIFLTYGICGGLLLVILNSLIQFNAPKKYIGRILSHVAAFQNIIMLFSLILIYIISNFYIINNNLLFFILTAISCIAFIYAFLKTPQYLARYILYFGVFRRFKTSILGFNNIPSEGPVLLLGNHISHLDWIIIYLTIPRQIRFVISEQQDNPWYLKKILKWIKAIHISDDNNYLEVVHQILAAGGMVCLFPEVNITRNAQLGTFQNSFEIAVKNTGAVIVPFYIHGLWGSKFSFASNNFQKNSKLKNKRTVYLNFGQPMPENTSANIVKAQILHLSINSWLELSKSLPSIPIAWLQTVKRNLGKTAVIDSKLGSFSHRKLLAISIEFCRILKQHIANQDRVGVLLPTCSTAIITNLSLWITGKTVVNLNYTTGANTLDASIKSADLKTIITSKEFLEKLIQRGQKFQEVLAQTNVVYLEDIHLNIIKKRIFITMLAITILPEKILKYLFFINQNTERIAAILFSSGSEGIPKGVMLSHRNIVANIKQVAGILNAQENDILLGVLPLFHALGLTVTSILPLIESIPVVCHSDPRDGVSIGQLAERYRVTFLFATPTFLYLYARNKNLKASMFKTIRWTLAGAERVSPIIRQAFFDKFKQEIFEGYGTTETTPIVSVNVQNFILDSNSKMQKGHKPGSVGLPIPGSAVRIVNPETMQELPTGEHGLIIIGGTQIMLGYLNDKERTEKSIVEIDGVRWYKTGDKGFLDEDGFITITDRYSRFAKIGGEMVSLSTVEENIHTFFPQIVDSIAVAIPEPKHGERIILLYVGDIDKNIIKKTLLQNQVSSFFIPNQYFAVEQIPILASGKKDLGLSKKIALSLLENNY